LSLLYSEVIHQFTNLAVTAVQHVPRKHLRMFSVC